MGRLLRLLPLLFLPALAPAQPSLHVGSKRFTESYILAEIVTGTARRAGEAQVSHRPGLGNTAIVFAALKSGSIDVYPEYTGTIALELLGRSRVESLGQLNDELARSGLAVGIPLGFGNSYALAMHEERAASLRIARISDLRSHPGLRLAISQEFLNRKDGWPALRAAYELPYTGILGLDHGLAYQALSGGEVDVIDVYATDARLSTQPIRILEDDRHFFPTYDAVLLYRRDLPHRLPRTWRALEALQGKITVDQMIGMNAAAELSGMAFSRIAEEFLEGRIPGIASRQPPSPERESFARALVAPDLWRLTGQHLVLVLASLGLGVMTGLPLGVWAHRAPQARGWIMGAAGVLQTVPSLALLAFLIAALDRIGMVPAVIALFLYSLLPIIRNTEAGLGGVSPAMRESAKALGLTAWPRLRLIELPLAARTILAGIKTSAVINVGTATIAAFIGAGGYGERIVAGLAVNDRTLMLAGAVPAAFLALAIQGLFEMLERRLAVPGRSGER